MNRWNARFEANINCLSNFVFIIIQLVYMMCTLFLGPALLQQFRVFVTT